jgi:hypothetical protein
MVKPKKSEGKSKDLEIVRRIGADRVDHMNRNRPDTSFTRLEADSARTRSSYAWGPLALSAAILVLGQDLMLRAHVSWQLALSCELAAASIGLLCMAIRSIRREVAREQRVEAAAGPDASNSSAIALCGQAYDAVLDDVDLEEVLSDAAGYPVLALSYRSRCTIFLDESGTPVSAEASGPGRAQLIPSGRRKRAGRLRDAARALKASAAPLTMTERGIVTSGGPQADSCRLATVDGATGIEGTLVARAATSAI